MSLPACTRPQSMHTRKGNCSHADTHSSSDPDATFEIAAAFRSQTIPADAYCNLQVPALAQYIHAAFQSRHLAGLPEHTCYPGCIPTRVPWYSICILHQAWHAPDPMLLVFRFSSKNPNRAHSHTYMGCWERSASYHHFFLTTTKVAAATTATMAAAAIHLPFSPKGQGPDMLHQEHFPLLSELAACSRPKCQLLGTI